MRNPRGFSLVDLLVSLAIIAVLVALTLPLLSEAQESARRIKCASHQRSMYTAITLYANDYQNRLPPSVFTRGGAFSSPLNLDTLRIGDDSTFNSLRNQNGYDGLGILYSENYLQPPPTYFYCPSYTGNNNFEANVAGLTSGDTNGFDRVTSNYIYRGKGPDGSTQLTQLSSTVALVSDSFTDPEYFNHESGLNVAAAGGQVVWIRDSGVIRQRAIALLASAPPGQTGSSGDGLSNFVWPFLDKGLDSQEQDTVEQADD